MSNISSAGDQEKYLVTTYSPSEYSSPGIQNLVRAGMKNLMSDPAKTEILNTEILNAFHAAD